MTYKISTTQTNISYTICPQLAGSGRETEKDQARDARETRGLLQAPLLNVPSFGFYQSAASTCTYILGQ